MTAEEFFSKASNLMALGSVSSATPKGSLALPTAYTCIKVISETIGMLPVHHYRKTDNGREILDDALSDVVAYRPNSSMTAADFYATWIANTLAYGYGIVRIERVGGQLRLRPAKSEWVKIDKLQTGDLVYDIHWDGNENYHERVFEPDVLHLKGLGFDGLKAKAPVEYAAEAYGFALSAQKYGAEFFKNGAHIKGFIELPTGVKLEGTTKEDRRSTWQRIKQGVLGSISGEGSAGGVGLLEAGMKFQAVSLPNDQAQFLESRKFSREEIAAMFRVPAYMVGEMGGAIKSNIEQQSIEFIQYAVMPWLVKMEQEMKHKLLQGRRAEYFKFNVNAYLRGTALERAQYLKEMRYAGLITEAEGRKYEDWPAVPTEGSLMRPKNVWGDEEYELNLQKLRSELNANP